MGLIVRFPLERARAIPPLAGGEGASIHVLPVVSIERAVEVLGEMTFAPAETLEPETKPRSRGGRPRRRSKRPA
jgi:hypothetical protein